MTVPALQLADRRAARDRARAEFKRRLGLAKIDLSPLVLKKRAIGEMKRTAWSATEQAVDIASDNRGIVAATAATIVLWLTRRPIASTASRLVARLRRRKSLNRRMGDQMRQTTTTYWQKLKDYADD